MTPISFATVIKNRTKISVMHENNQLELRLFENNLLSLISLITPSDSWEYIIVDYESTDVNMHEFIAKLPKKDNLHFKIFTLNTPFDKGAGLNYASSLVTNPVVFFIDADMMVKTRNLFDDVEKYVVKENKVLFPICWSYSNPQHTDGWRRCSGKGNVIQRKETIVPYIHNKNWGIEDDTNFNHYSKLNMTYRTYYGDQFVHQWHPNELRRMFYTSNW